MDPAHGDWVLLYDFLNFPLVPRVIRRGDHILASHSSVRRVLDIKVVEDLR